MHTSNYLQLHAITSIIIYSLLSGCINIGYAVTLVYHMVLAEAQINLGMKNSKKL